MKKNGETRKNGESIDICQKCHGNLLGKEIYFQQMAQNKPNVSKKNKYYTLSQKVYFALHYASLKKQKSRSQTGTKYLQNIDQAKAL